jgi:cyclopropane fatty-acyl-phospholipid synthase-like methyltransferase
VNQTELSRQQAYWDGEVAGLDSVYSRQKGKLGIALDSVFRRDMFQRFEFTMKRAEPILGRSFLDVGCGTGRYSIELARRGARAVVGLDIAENMIDVCREVARREGLEDRASFLHSDLFAFRDAEAFDACLGIGLFDYISDPLPVLKKMKEHTRDIVILSFPRRWTWRAPVRKIRLALRRCNVRFYSKREIRRLMQEAGFGSLDLEKIGKLYCVSARTS